MIDYKTLMPGNLVIYNAEDTPMLCEIDALDIVSMESKAHYRDLHAPIPLTKELLIEINQQVVGAQDTITISWDEKKKRFGLHADLTFLSKSIFLYWMDNEASLFIELNERSSVFLCTVEHLHLLQNFATIVCRRPLKLDKGKLEKLICVKT